MIQRLELFDAVEFNATLTVSLNFSRLAERTPQPAPVSVSRVSATEGSLLSYSE